MSLAALAACALVNGCQKNCGLDAPAPAVEVPAAPPVARELPPPASSPEERLERGSCYATFDDVADAWEALRGALPVECRAAADGFEVRLVPVVPCTADDGGPVAGCVVRADRAVYLDAASSPAGLVFVSAHEWLHLLAACAEGDSDGDHLDAGLWSLREGVLGLATSNPPVGPCVEEPAELSP